MPPHSSLGCAGPEQIFNGAAAMKPWKRSSATNEPRSACLSFRLDPKWSDYGPILVGARQLVRGHRPAGAVPSGTRGRHAPVLAHQLASARKKSGDRDEKPNPGAF